MIKKRRGSKKDTNAITSVQEIQLSIIQMLFIDRVMLMLHRFILMWEDEASKHEIRGGYEAEGGVEEIAA